MNRLGELRFRRLRDEWDTVVARFDHRRIVVGQLPEDFAADCFNRLRQADLRFLETETVDNNFDLLCDAFLAIKQATEKIKTLPADDIQDLKSGNPQKIAMMRNLYRALEDVAALAGVKL